MLCDFDRKGMPSPMAATIADRGGLWPAALVVLGFTNAARVMRASTSAGLRRIDTGEALPHSGGEHHYILAADGADIGRALRTLHDMCWLHGLGWYLIGASGQMLERSIVDSSVRFGERLCFEGATSRSSLRWCKMPWRAPVAHEGCAIDTKIVIPVLRHERARIDEVKQRARSELEPRAVEVRAAADRRVAEDICTAPACLTWPRCASSPPGITVHSCLIMLDFDHFERVSNGEVLADADKFIGERLPTLWRF